VHTCDEDHARPEFKNINTWTGLRVEETIRITEDRDGESTSIVCPTLGSRTAKEQYKTVSRKRCKTRNTSMCRRTWLPVLWQFLGKLSKCNWPKTNSGKKVDVNAFSSLLLVFSRLDYMRIVIIVMLWAKEGKSIDWGPISWVDWLTSHYSSSGTCKRTCIQIQRSRENGSQT